MGHLLEVLLDWVDESRPFFHWCTDAQRKLSDIVEPFLTPIYSRNFLCAAVKGKNQQLHFEDPFAFDLRTLPVGTRVVFSFSRQLNPYSENFLNADRTADYSYWNFSSYCGLRLPRVYSPSSPVNPKSQTGAISHLEFVIPGSSHNFIVVLKDSELWALEPKNWDEEEAFIRIPPNQPLHNTSWLGTGYKPGCFNIIREGHVEELVWGGWDIKSIGLPSSLLEFKGKFSSYFTNSEHNSLFQLIDMNLWLQRPGSNPEQILFTSEKGLVTPGKLIWLPNGAVIFSDKDRRGLFYGDLSVSYSGVNARDVFGPVEHPSLSFCVDAKGIVYVIENDNQRLNVLLPATHWKCFVCGGHGANSQENKSCVICGAALPKPPPEPYYKWFDLDLSDLGSRFGPMTIDSDLNLYIVADGHNIVALPLEKKDFWGEEN